MPFQQTLKSNFTLSGTGLHTGTQSTITVAPAEPNSGRVLVANGTEIPLLAEYISDTQRSTALTNHGNTVRTVEHLLAALFAAEIDNVLVVLEGIEIPILDGSSAPFLASIEQVGIVEQGVDAQVLRITEPVEITIGNSFIRAIPADQFELHVKTEFDEWPEGLAEISITVSHEAFRGIASARTFAFRNEVNWLISQGLAQGGSLENALVITPPNEFSTALRMPQEWCAHKALDVIGDLALIGKRLALRIEALRPGHTINSKLANLLAERATL